MEVELENLSGSVEEIVYRNDENGYTVMGIVCDDGESVTAVGKNLGNVSVGEQVLLNGTWNFHATYGRQFRVEKFQQTLPADTGGILRYLASGIIKGVGESTALKIVKTFGSDSFHVIENEPERLTEIRGISPAKARKINTQFKSQFAIREVMIGLTDLGLTQKEAFQAYNMFKSDALDIIRENPYAFISDHSGYSFKRADEIAAGMARKPDFSYRAQAGAVQVIRENLGNGHTCFPRNSVIAPAKTLLECSEDDVEIAIDCAIEAKQLIQENISGREFLFLPEIYEAEKSIGDRIRLMTKFPPQKSEIFTSEIFAFESANHIEFDEKQRRAIEIAVNKGLLILTGGPGTGKTTTVKGIISLMQNRGFQVALAAPTGRAAKRMTELTGYEAKTIHRLLEVEYKDSSSVPEFCYNRRNPLNYDAVIVDELSMVDVTIFSALLDAIPLHCRLIMVGDKDQLPPVGAGKVLSDLIESGFIDMVSLDKVFRQAMESLIVTNAHRVVKGEMPDLTRNDADSDFFLLKEENQYLAAKKTADLVTRRIPAGYGFDPMTEIQVLCPSHKGEVGTEHLNALLQNRLNPAQLGKAALHFNGYTLREGDKVMQIKNNYDVPWFRAGENGTGVFNGDIGILTKIDKAADIINVRFDDREAMYSIASAKELELAYAMTVHKSQGSEFEAVILPVIGAPEKLSYRNLFYTALTRAKNLLILVGSERAVARMVKNDKKSCRHSALVHFLSVDNEDNII